MKLTALTLLAFTLSTSPSAFARCPDLFSCFGFSQTGICHEYVVVNGIQGTSIPGRHHLSKSLCMHASDNCGRCQPNAPVSDEEYWNL